ncbi:hypothetical protein QEG98_02780 [Myxococcus sp. MxC21-1]|uniref:hypothetical protein n=1 Tax=Myxococcus sp. MxC21-1 TaxID=3041439 RepID=UPI00292F98B8|nr:hypothetical protein [Myxococcus sp. MxC21-1]WNZ62761.1 hypothetical protein QEG98_02780 [Myxococcus sp. MxC21-1]
MTAPKRSAWTPPSSRRAVTPGIAAAERHSSPCSQSLPVPSGLRKSTKASSRPCAFAITNESSPMLARVQGQSGCASITSVGRPSTRGTVESPGQRAGAARDSPGVRE